MEIDYTRLNHNLEKYEVGDLIHRQEGATFTELYLMYVKTLELINTADNSHLIFVGHTHTFLQHCALPMFCSILEAEGVQYGSVKSCMVAKVGDVKIHFTTVLGIKDASKWRGMEVKHVFWDNYV